MSDAAIQVNSADSESMIDWDDLFYDLKKERTVLILGTDFHRDGESTVKERLYQELVKRNDHGIIHFYPKNGIFLFEKESAKVRARKLASEFYKSLTYDDTLLQKIIELPFRMIINTNPDRSLERKYIEKDIQYQFDFFTSKFRRECKELKEPDKYFPLIFNLFGSVDAIDSLVLDFEDIFDHLTASLNSQNISEVVRSVLQDTDSYIFVGFQYEKWDTQLLFRYLNMKKHPFDDSKKNYTTRSLNVDVDSESFFRQQFNLRYYGAPIDFINTMHRKYFELSAAEDSNRMAGLSPQKTIESYVANDQTEEALNYLTHLLRRDDETQELVLIKSRYTRYKFLKSRKLEQAELLEVMINKINQSIIELATNF